jgi:hypothetical protein
MTQAERLRAQAQRCMSLARETVATDVARAMEKLAVDYLTEAQALEQLEGQRPARYRTPLLGG